MRQGATVASNRLLLKSAIQWTNMCPRISSVFLFYSLFNIDCNVPWQHLRTTASYKCFCWAPLSWLQPMHPLFQECLPTTHSMHSLQSTYACQGQPLWSRATLACPVPSLLLGVNTNISLSKIVYLLEVTFLLAKSQTSVGFQQPNNWICVSKDIIKPG